MNHLTIFENYSTESAIEWLKANNKNKKAKYSLEEGYINVIGDVDLRNLQIMQYNFPKIKFGKVKGDFDISGNYFENLDFAPSIVTKSFICTDNILRNLKNSPSVGKHFYCDKNHLESLEGAPWIIKGDFSCGSNSFKNFKGGPRKVKGDFSAIGCNNITNFVGTPYEIGGNMHFNDCRNIKSFAGFPKKLKGFIDVRHSILEKQIGKFIINAYEVQTWIKSDKLRKTNDKTGVFEKWDNPIAQSSKLRSANNTFGIFDEEIYEMPNEKALADENEIVNELLKIKDILKASGIESEIEILYEQAKEQVGQYHILVFEYENDKLYATHFVAARTIAIYHYGHTSLCEYKIPMTENYTNYIEELKDPHDEFNKLLLYGPDKDNPNYEEGPPSKEQIKREKMLSFKEKILKKIAEEDKLKIQALRKKNQK